jgi:hypothetical protein
MGKQQDFQRVEPEPRSFEDSRTIDVADEAAVRFWSQRLGVPPEEIVEAVKAVGPNTTAVLLKLDAPHKESVAPPTMTPRP